MASNTYNMNTWGAKRIFGDTHANLITDALLQITANNTWILSSGRQSTYGIKYVYDSSTDHDKIELYGGYQVSSADAPTAWVQLDTGDVYILGQVGINHAPDTYQLYVDGTSYFDDDITVEGNVVPNQTNTYTLGTSSLRWSKLYVGTADSYGSTTQPIYWNAGVPGILGTIGGQYEPVWVDDGTVTAITAGTNAQFYRGDKTWSNTLTGALEIPILKLHQGTAADPSLTGNARIEFDYSNGQPVVISYTPNDSYRSPAGLKVMGGSSATPAWFEVEGELITGMRQVTSGPSSITYANRLTIVPYFHTGGPWYIKSGDDSSNAYLALYYNTTQLMRIKHDGTQMIDWKGNAATATKATQDGSGNTITSYYCTLSTAQTISGTKTFTGNLNIGASAAGGYLNGSATNGGINSIRIGDDVWLGDCNQGGIMGMKSTGASGGIWIYNSGGNNVGRLVLGTTAEIRCDTIINFLTIGGGCQHARLGRIGLADAYANINLTNYRFHCVGNARITGQILLDAGFKTGSRVGGSGSGVEIGTDGGIEIFHSSTPFIDFHYAATTADYSVRLICNSASNLNCTGSFSATKVTNAVWNDYAECRQVEIEEPGYCVTETISGEMIKTYERLQAGCKIISDTYGTLMGYTDVARTPIAVAGRVLVYPYRNKEEYSLGAAVCSAPGGMVDIMTRDEIMMYPERIIGTVSEIPNYEIWRGGNQDGKDDIKVNGRIWIYVR